MYRGILSYKLVILQGLTEKENLFLVNCMVIKQVFLKQKICKELSTRRKAVSTVNSGSDRRWSQFLITTGENLDYLDGVHTVFGEVTEGMDIVKKINETFVDKDFVPYQDIRINHTVILDDPFDDPRDLVIPDWSPEPQRKN